MELWLALRFLKSQTSSGKIAKVGYALFMRHMPAMKDQSDDIKDQSDMDSEVSGAETEVADAEVASPVLPTTRAGILCRHSSCPEDDPNRRAWFFFHLM